MTERIISVTERQQSLIETLEDRLDRRHRVINRLERLKNGKTKKTEVSVQNRDGTATLFEASDLLVKVANKGIFETYRDLVFEQVPDPTQPNGFKTVKNEDMAEVANGIINDNKIINDYKADPKKTVR